MIALWRTQVIRKNTAAEQTHHTRAKPQSITWVCDVNTRSIKQMLKLSPTAKKDTTKSWASVCSVMPSLCQTETVPHWSHEEKPAIFQDLWDKNKCEYYSCEITRVQASSFPVEVSWRKIRTRPWRSRGSWALWRGLVSSHDWHADRTLTASEKTYLEFVCGVKQPENIQRKDPFSAALARFSWSVNLNSFTSEHFTNLLRIYYLHVCIKKKHFQICMHITISVQNYLLL